MAVCVSHLLSVIDRFVCEAEPKAVTKLSDQTVTSPVLPQFFLLQRLCYLPFSFGRSTKRLRYLDPSLSYS